MLFVLIYRFVYQIIQTWIQIVQDKDLVLRLSCLCDSTNLIKLMMTFVSKFIYVQHQIRAMIVSNKHNHTFFILIYLLQSHSFPFELGVDYSSPHSQLNPHRQEIRPLVVGWHLSDMSVRSKLYHTDPVQMTAERYSFLGDKIRKKNQLIATST